MRPTIALALVVLGVGIAVGCRDDHRNAALVPAPGSAAPTVTSVNPVSGDVAGGTVILITGTGFKSGAVVRIGGTAATSVTVMNSTTITATTPAGVAGPADVRVTNSGGGAGTLVGGFTYTSGGGNAAPTFASIAPASGSTAGGTLVTIAGSGFYAGVTVTVGGTLATGLTLVSGASLTCTTPAGAAGAANVVVTNADAQSATGTGAFTFVAPPAISGIAPANGPQSGGITVTISGTGFVSGATVTFGPTAATVTSFSATALEVTLPVSASSGAVTVTVTNPDTQNDTTSFTYDPPPAPTSVSPSAGPLAGGNTVTVIGTNFVNGGGLAVRFGTQAATGVTWLSATQIQCLPPAGTGTVGVTVTNPDTQTGTVVGAYTYNPAPTVTAVNVNTGPATGGTTVTVTGTGFLTGATVLFGSTLATNVTRLSATQIRCDTPAGTGAVAVTVTNTDGQSGQLASAFTYTGSGFTVTIVQPGSGTVNGGTPVTITGTGFKLGATVTFGGNAATGVMVLSATSILAVTPAGTGSVTVTVNNPGGGTASWGSSWSYVTAGTQPAISALNPSSGPAAGGTTVTVTGSNFGTAPVIAINGIGATVTGSSASSVTITTPAALHCVAGGAQPVKATDTTTGETSSPFSGFTYVPNQTEALTGDLSLPDVVIDGAGTIHVVFQTNPSAAANDIQYRRSTDGGRTWGVGGLTSGRVTQTSNNSTNARVAARGNTVFIVWMEAATNTTCDYIYSTDNGANWTSIASLPSNTAAAVLGFPDVTIDGNGRVYAVWMETGNVGPWGTDIDIWTVSGTPSGIGSGTPVRISGAGNFCSQPAIDGDGAGNAIAAWHATANGPVVTSANTIRWSRTTNSGTSWSTAASLTGGTSSPTSVGVALRGSDAVIAYVDVMPAVSTTYAVRSYYSTNTGQSWVGAVTIRTASTNAITSSAIAVDGGGFFSVAWSESGASQVDIFCSQSSDVGVTWTSPVAFAPSGTASTEPRVAAGAAGKWALAWSENNAGTRSIVHW